MKKGQIKGKNALKPNMALLDRGVPILFALAREFTVWDRSKKFGVEFSIS